MKRLILLVAVVAFATQLNAQKMTAKDVPAEVKSAFKKAYPMEKDIEWSKEGSNYEAEYDTKSGDHSATYTAAGKLVETEMDIKTSSLPKGVIDYLKLNHKDHKIKEASRVTNVDGTITYETEVNGMELIFDSNGTYIKSVKA